MREQSSGIAGVALAVARRPALWRTATVQARRLVPSRWWARPPHLPVPDRAYLRFRMETQYGDPDAAMRGPDVVSWLEWCKAFEQTCRPPLVAGR